MEGKAPSRRKERDCGDCVVRSAPQNSKRMKTSNIRNGMTAPVLDGREGSAQKKRNAIVVIVLCEVLPELKADEDLEHTKWDDCSSVGWKGSSAQKKGTRCGDCVVRSAPQNSKRMKTSNIRNGMTAPVWMEGKAPRRRKERDCGDCVVRSAPQNSKRMKTSNIRNGMTAPVLDGREGSAQKKERDCGDWCCAKCSPELKADEDLEHTKWDDCSSVGWKGRLRAEERNAIVVIVLCEVLPRTQSG